METEPSRANDGRRRVDPLAVWRWGFAAFLLVLGVWLVWKQPQIGGASGRTLGWVVIGYAVVRTLLSQLGRMGWGRSGVTHSPSKRESA